MATIIVDQIKGGVVYHKGLEMTNILNAWHVTKGESIRVAVLDTGACLLHPDLRKNIKAHYDFVSDKEDVKDLSESGHGTSVAGIIAASGHKTNGTEEGFYGVAPEAELFVAKVLECTVPDSEREFQGAIVKAIKWSIGHKVHIINISLECPRSTSIVKVIEEAVRKGIFVICGAGNKGEEAREVSFPAVLKNTIAVGAVDDLGRLLDSSSLGSVDIVAPGKDILSTNKDGKYIINSGTSMACAFVTGVVALALSKHLSAKESNSPINNVCDLKQHLKWTADETMHDFFTGVDKYYGAGLIDPSELIFGENDRCLELDSDDLTEEGKSKIQFLSESVGIHLRGECINEMKQIISVSIKHQNHE